MRLVAERLGFPIESEVVPGRKGSFEVTVHYDDGREHLVFSKFGEGRHAATGEVPAALLALLDEKSPD